MYDIDLIRPVWAEINLDNLAHNMREVRKIVHKNAMIAAVIKADAYGDGAKYITDVLSNNGADKFAVAVLDEALDLRKAGVVQDILVLGYTQPERAREIVEYGIEQSVYSYDVAKSISEEAVRQNKEAKLHIKIDTGMGRIGLKVNEETVSLVKRINFLPCVDIEGIFTHFAVADEKDKSYTFEQYEKFSWMCTRLKEEGVDIKLRHCGNSAIILDLPEMHMDMVRAGIILYGLVPSKEVSTDKINLKQVMSLKARIIHVKEMEKGESISYGREFVTKRKSQIASLSLGYADGYTRMLSNKAEVLIKGKRVPVVGRICMDHCMIDVTDIEDVEVGDEVVLFGEQSGAYLSVNELAEKLGTLNYEIVCMISKRVPRVYKEKGEVVNIINNIWSYGYSNNCIK